MPIFQVLVDCSARWSATVDVEADTPEEAEAAVSAEMHGDQLIEELFNDDIDIDSATCEDDGDDDETEEDDEDEDDGEEEDNDE